MGWLTGAGTGYVVDEKTTQEKFQYGFIVFIRAITYTTWRWTGMTYAAALAKKVSELAESDVDEARIDRQNDAGAYATVSIHFVKGEWGVES